MATKLEPIHPGEILYEEFMRPRGITSNGLAVALRVPAPTVYGIVREKRGISPDMALRLARYFGTTSEFWSNLQARYSLEIERERGQREIDREVIPLSLGAQPAMAQVCYYTTITGRRKHPKRSTK